MACYGYISGSEYADLKIQETAMLAAGCSRIFCDTGDNKPERNLLFTQLKLGDQLIVWRLDKFASSVADLSMLLEAMKKHKILFQSVQEGLNTETMKHPERFKRVVKAMADIEESLSEKSR